MKKLLLASAALMMAGGSALAADIGMPGYDWTGFYVGGQVIADFTQFNEAFPFNLSSSKNLGAGVSGQYLRQDGHLVYGLAANADLFAADTKTGCLDGGPVLQCQSGSASDASIRAKLGFANDRVVFYGTAGWGISNVYNRVWPSPVSLETDSHTLGGWVAGAGISYALNDRLIGTVEVLHYDLGSGTPTLFNADGTAVTKPVSNTVSLGLSYKF